MRLYLWWLCCLVCVFFFFFFFQAEDGIRDYKVTGVQTCALPFYFMRFMTVSEPVEQSAFVRIKIGGRVVLWNWLAKLENWIDVRRGIGKQESNSDLRVVLPINKDSLRYRRCPVTDRTSPCVGPYSDFVAVS